jgi:hypothetical protein
MAGKSKVVSTRPLFASLSPRRPGSLRVGFVMGKMALGHVFSCVFRVSPVIVIPPGPILRYHVGD